MRSILMITLVIFSFLSFGNAQDSWYYHPELNIHFSTEDSLANPFLCTVDSTGNFWVLSSTSTTLNAINALYKASPGDTVFTLIDDYTTEVDVHSARGITAIGNDIYVFLRSTTLYLSFAYGYQDGDSAERTIYNQSGYGTYVYGCDATRDGFIFGGIIYQGPKIRVYDYSGNSTPVGHYVSPDCINKDPGGPSPAGADVIRDVAVMKSGNYFDSNTPVYTSRNSLPGGNQGGVTKWTGGTQDNPENYAGVSLEDADSFLKWTSYVPNGLTIDMQGRLWAVGTDSSRRWVKCFDVDGSWATQVAELPSSTSGDIADPGGAPLEIPEDVALSPDNNTAYVIDVGTKMCYVFTTSQTEIAPILSIATDFKLFPAYPNPFNPQTTIRFYLPSATNVTLTVYDMVGSPVRTLMNEICSAGVQYVTFNAADLASGIYLLKLQTIYGQRQSKVLLMK